MPEAYLTGRYGEELAARFLMEDGWSIIDRNFRFRQKEIDLVARSGHQVIFVEVKTRRSLEYGHPFEAIGPRKRKEILTAARAWMARHGRVHDLYRFDAIAILLHDGAPPTLEHLEDAWRI